MAQYATLKAAINAVIKANGQKEITGTVLNEVLTSMVNSLGANYQFAGVATPSTNPGTPDQNVFYLAGEGGTYTNFNNIAIPNGISFLIWNGSWSSQTVLSGDGGVFDISAYKATGGTLATFADLSAALGVDGANVPVAFRKGGMSVKFIQGNAPSSDNKYVQARCMAQNFTTDVTQWQGIDDEPTAGSKNLVESGGIYDLINSGYTFKGAGTPSTDPGTPNIKVFYIVGKGFYSNFGASFVVREGQFAIVKYNPTGTFWEYNIFFDVYGYRGIQYFAIQPFKYDISSNQVVIPKSTKVFYEDTSYSVPNDTTVNWTTGYGNLFLVFNSNTKEFNLVPNAYTLSVNDVVLGWIYRDTTNKKIATRNIELALINDTYAEWLLVNDPLMHLQEVNNRMYFADLDNDFYLEESDVSDGSIYISFSRLRLYINQTGSTYTPAQLASLLSVSLTTSPKGVSDCIPIAHGHILAFDTVDRTLVLTNDRNDTRFIHLVFCVDGRAYQMDQRITSMLLPKTLQFKEEIYDGVKYVKQSDLVQGDIYTNGSYRSNATGVCSTTYYPCSKGKMRVVYPNDTTKNWIIAIAFYDNSKNFLYRVGYLWDDTTEINIAENAAFFRFGLKAYELDRTTQIENIAVSDYVNNSLQIAIDNLNGRVFQNTNREEKHFIEIPIGEVVNGKIQSDGSVDTSATGSEYTCCTNQMMMIPYEGARIHVKAPNNIAIVFLYGTLGTQGGSGFIRNGNYWNIPSPTENLMFQFYWIDPDGNASTVIQQAMTPKDIYDAIDSHQLALYVEEPAGDIVERVKSQETYIRSTLYKMSSTLANNVDNFMPIFLHITDIHGDMVRMKNAIEYADYIGVDGILDSGDAVVWYNGNGLGTLRSLFNISNIPHLVCIGNHETKKTRDTNAALDDVNTTLNSQLIAPANERFEFSMPSASDYDDAPTYYYKDFTIKKIRVIVLNQYETGKLNFNAGRYSQKQINWLIATLLATPADYGIVLMYHQPNGLGEKDNNADKFYQSLFLHSGTVPTTDWALPQVDGNPIAKIIDAFISKTTLSDSFTQTIATGTETITISADFTEVNSGVEFIAHVCGHMHSDAICDYANTTNRQLVLDVTTGCSVYGKDNAYNSYNGGSDLARGGKGVTQDCFTLYAIDRASGYVRVCRVGSNFDSRQLTLRDTMAIKYRD